ncbi:MAG: radical SAM family heme chaperone HemW [Gammaproteobacteria bacterium]|nr:radical SAM family heme chaperone HemW [Gammaproteobacteria bacterium]
MLELPPLGLYVHIPWCVRKCPYCDFNSHERPGAGIPEAAYVEALCGEIALNKKIRLIETVFFGGGTPSLFQPESFARLHGRLAERKCLAPEAEITLEANPGTAEAGRFAAYRAAGINRLSIGVQSFDDAALARLGRIHGGADARAAFTIAREAGFDNINLDLMFGLPRQSQSQALRDLETAIALAPEHISWYQLTLEPNTVFWRRPPRLPPERLIDTAQEAGIALLESAGYARYEVSAFARPGKACRHNLNYWRFGDYLGIGAGAHGKLTDPAADRIIRTRKTRMPSHYLAAAEKTMTSEVAHGERPLEYLMNTLRLREGFAPADFERRTGIAFDAIGEKLECLRRDGLLEGDGNTIRASARGYRLLDSLLGKL